MAIGGWNEGSLKYSNVASSAAKRKKFLSDAVQFLKTYGFDGLDLDWEYPASRGGAASDKVRMKYCSLSFFLFHFYDVRETSYRVITNYVACGSLKAYCKVKLLL